MFDASESDGGGCTLEAMASVPPPRLGEVLSEVQQVLTWLSHPSQGAHHGPQPLDDGGDWDMQLHTQADSALPQNVDWSASHGLATVAVPANTRWVAVTLTLAISAALAEPVVHALVDT